MPIRGMLQDGSFSPDEVQTLTTAFEDCLRSLQLIDRNDPVVTLVAQRVIDLGSSRKGDAISLRDAVLKSFRVNPPPRCGFSAGPADAIDSSSPTAPAEPQSPPAPSS